MIKTSDNLKTILIFMPDVGKRNAERLFMYTTEKEFIRQFLNNNKLLIECELFMNLDITSYHNDKENIVNNTINTINNQTIGNIISANASDKSKLTPLIVWDSYDNCVNSVIDETKFTKYFDYIIQIQKGKEYYRDVCINVIKSE